MDYLKARDVDHDEIKSLIVKLLIIVLTTVIAE
jgi:hypothetical protein